MTDIFSVYPRASGFSRSVFGNAFERCHKELGRYMVYACPIPL